MSKTSPRGVGQSGSVESAVQVKLVLISAAAALLGSLIGVGGSLFVANQSSQDERDARRRDVRVDAYAEVYAATAEYLADIGSVAPLVIEERVKTEPNLKELRRLDQRLDAHAQNIFRTQSRLVLVGAPDVVDAGFALGVAAEETRQTLTADDLTTEDIQPALERMAGALDDFGLAARTDVDTP